jgi:hypothetical protein
LFFSIHNFTKIKLTFSSDLGVIGGMAPDSFPNDKAISFSNGQCGWLAVDPRPIPAIHPLVISGPIPWPTPNTIKRSWNALS